MAGGDGRCQTMSDPAEMLRRVYRVNGSRMFRRMLPRRWKRCIGIAALVVLLVRPDLATQAVVWVRQERAERAATLLTDTVSPLLPPAQQPAPPAPLAPPVPPVPPMSQ